MIRLLHGTLDDALASIQSRLEQYQQAHPEAEITLYRRGGFSVRIRVIDPTFEGMTRPDRHREIWTVLRGLPEQISNQLGILIPVAPSEVSTSGTLREFGPPSTTLSEQTLPANP
jgi:stress-induced morphogen